MAKLPDDRCAKCNHHSEQHIKGICHRCIGGRMMHKYEEKVAS